MIVVCENVAFLFCVFFQMGAHGMLGGELNRKNNTEARQEVIGKWLDETRGIQKYQRMGRPNLRNKRSIYSPSFGEFDAFGTFRFVWFNFDHYFKCVRNDRSANVTCHAGQEIFARHIKCYYDRACFETFYDCCPDYVKHCGNQTKATGARKRNGRSYSWTCVPYINKNCDETGVLGVWMIQSCPLSWPANQIKLKCQSSFYYVADIYIPVVGENGLTYRNKYCAICNGIRNYSLWEIQLHTSVIAPEEYDLNDKLKFIFDNGGSIEHIEPTTDQPRRYCTVLSEGGCKNVSHREYQNCVNGPVQVVISRPGRYFKNIACALCQGQDNITSCWAAEESCRGPYLRSGFSLLFRLKTLSSKQIGKILGYRCAWETVYNKARFCHSYGVPSDAVDILRDQFAISMWLVRYPSDVYNEDLLPERRFKKVIGDKLALRPNQISALQLRIQIPKTSLVATFRVTLTPFDSLERLNRSSGTEHWFLRPSDRQENFTIDFVQSRWKVLRMVTEQLSCLGKKVFSFEEHKVDKKDGKIVQKRTGETIQLKDYTILAETKDNITLCPQFVLSNCVGGTYVQLLRHEYVIFSDLSLYHNASNQSYAFGKYYVNNHDEDDKVEGLFRNSTIFICVPLKKPYPADKVNSTISEHANRYSLWILTVSGFTISIVSLILVLITYSLFQELRTIPGKNMMNLCISLLIFQSLWLLRSLQEEGTMFCLAAAILEHYFILVSFVAMSVISYHSCIVFSNRSIALKKSKKEQQKVFIKYSAIVWILTALFIAVCLALDQTNVFLIKYGTLCWLGTKNSKIYFFLLPIGLSLVWNIFAFIRTSIFLSQHKKRAAKLQQKGTQNLLICVKLSTLTGFPWLFAFLGASFENVVAFEYLFVIFVCSQGFYIAGAFLWNSKTLKLYRHYFNKRKVSALS